MDRPTRPDGPPRPLDGDVRTGRRDRRCRHRGRCDGLLHPARHGPAACCWSSVTEWGAARRGATRASSPRTSSVRCAISPTSSASSWRLRPRAGSTTRTICSTWWSPRRAPRFGSSGSSATWACSTCTRCSCTCGATWSAGRAACASKTCLVSDEAEFVSQIPAEFAGLYSRCPAGAGPGAAGDPRRPLPGRSLRPSKGVPTAARSVQQVLAYLERRYPDRFRFVDHTGVDRVVVSEDRVDVHARGHSVASSRWSCARTATWTTTSRTSPEHPFGWRPTSEITGRVAYMTAFVDEPRPPAAMSYIRNATHRRRHGVRLRHPAHLRQSRRHRHPDLHGRAGVPVPRSRVRPGHALPGALLDAMDERGPPVRPAGRPPGLPYDFQWHGLMGYNDSGIRVVGAHPRHPRLLYNLGCNGVGFLPSIYGGQRVARLLAGEHLRPASSTHADSTNSVVGPGSKPAALVQGRA